MNTDFSDKIKNNLPVLIRGTLIGVLLTFLSMVVFAVFMLIFDIDRAFAVPFSTLSIAIGCFFASMYTAKCIESKGYLIGLSIGIIVFVIVTLVSLIVTKDDLSTNTLFHLIIILLSSVSGGIFGVNKTKKKKYI